MFGHLGLAPAGPTSGMQPRRLCLTLLTLLVGLVLATGPGAHALAASPVPGPSVSADSLKYYVVQASYLGQKEFLFEIADRFTGDGNRVGEIFALNQNRLQPDGSRLTNPTVLGVGWLLILPADARGAGISMGPLPCCATPVPPGLDRSVPSSPTGGLRSASASSVVDPAQLASPAQPVPAHQKSHHANPWVLVAVLVGIVLFILWPRHRDARRREATTHDDSPPVARALAGTTTSASDEARTQALAAVVRLPAQLTEQSQTEAYQRVVVAHAANRPEVAGSVATAQAADESVVSRPTATIAPPCPWWRIRRRSRMMAQRAPTPLRRVLEFVVARRVALACPHSCRSRGSGTDARDGQRPLARHGSNVGSNGPRVSARTVKLS